ncbi:MAG: presenilin family intramembrane aspartyl protease [Candidatus Micrarchaeota archaeon]
MMREISSIMLLFILVQFFGLYVGANMVEQAKLYVEFKDFNVAPTQDSGSALNSLYFLGTVLISATLLILLIRFYKGAFLFKLLEALVLFVASNIVFYVIFFLSGIVFYAELAILCALALAVSKFFFPKLKNFATVVASSGVGAIFGFSLDIFPAVVLAIGLSIYDVIAVFFTGHMIELAKAMSSRKLSFSVSTERAYQVKRKETKIVEGKEKEVEEVREEKSSLELGAGDMVIPLMLAVSAYKFAGLIPALAVVIGATVGLWFTLEYVFSRRTFLPALPPIVFSALLALGAALALKL